MQTRPRHASKEVRQLAEWLDDHGWVFTDVDSKGHTIWSWPIRGEYHGPSPKSTFMQYDETCHSDLLEWLVLDPKDVVCTGVMIRQLPHSLMDDSINRERYMRQLTGWDEAAGSQRPRTWGKGCAGELPNGVAWEWNNEPSNGQTLSYADGLRWERYAPEILPRLSRDYPEICGWAPVGAVRSRYAPEIPDHARAACMCSPRRPLTSPQVRSRGLRHHRGRLPRVSALRLPGSAAGRAGAIRDPFWDGVAKRCDPWA